MDIQDHLNDYRKSRRYGDFRPTAFDGHIDIDRENWIIVVSRNRDSDILTESNFDAALKSLGGESKAVEVHRFGHWGPGWFELIIVDPDSDKGIVAAEILNSLSNYPVLDEMDYSYRETEAIEEYWSDTMTLEDRIRACAKHGESIFAARRNSPPFGESLYEEIRTYATE